MTHCKNQSTEFQRIEGSATTDAGVTKGNGLMKRALASLFILFVLAGSSVAGDLPEAPSSVISANAAIEITPIASPRTSTRTSTSVRTESKIVDERFIALTVVSTGSTFSDSYTTLFARENWLAGKKGVCNAEVQSAYLYGTHPTVARAYAVASAKSVGAIAASYYLRKHHSKLWSLPLIGNSVISLQGTTQNMMACN